MTGLDTHVHAWAPAGPTRRPDGSLAEPPTDPSIDGAIAHLDAAGIERAVLVQPSLAGTDHGYLLDAAERHSARFRLVVLAQPSGEVGHLRPLASHPATIAIRLVPRLDPAADWFGPSAASVWTLAADHGLGIFVLADPPQLSGLQPWLASYPEVPVLIDHLGCPAPAAGEDGGSPLEGLAPFPNVRVKVSALSGLSATAFPFADMWGWVSRAVRAFGPERLAWGSDFPWLGGAASIAESAAAGRLALGAAGLDTAEIEGVMDGAALHDLWDRA